MKLSSFSYEKENAKMVLTTFQEPQYGLSEPKNVEWTMENYLFRYSGEGWVTFSITLIQKITYMFVPGMSLVLGKEINTI